jgi:hypothetical protein
MLQQPFITGVIPGDREKIHTFSLKIVNFTGSDK